MKRKFYDYTLLGALAAGGWFTSSVALKDLCLAVLLAWFLTGVADILKK